MATRNRTRVASKAIITAMLALAIFGGPLGRPTPAHALLRVNGADRRQEAMVDWAIARYRAAGLELPAVEIDFVSSEAGARCTLGGGFYEDGKIQLCTGVSVNLYARKVTLHEMAHAWAGWNLGNAQERAFLELRRLSSWNDLAQPWGERGGEQAAEIIAWGVGEGILTPLIPDNTPEHLQVAYEYLTGMAPPASRVAG